MKVDEKRHSMKYFYPAVFTDDKETNLFHMTFPDLAGCGATAETVEETLRKAREALGTSLWELEEKKIPPPPPSEELEIRRRFRYNQVYMILLDMEEYRAYRAYKVQVAAEETEKWASRARQERKSILRRVFGTR